MKGTAALFALSCAVVAWMNAEAPTAPDPISTFPRDGLAGLAAPGGSAAGRQDAATTEFGAGARSRLNEPRVVLLAADVGHGLSSAAADRVDPYDGGSDGTLRRFLRDEGPAALVVVEPEAYLLIGDEDSCIGPGIPALCDTDCNDNGVGDTCDLADSTSDDCNGNGVPDECEVGSYATCELEDAFCVVPGINNLHYERYADNRPGAVPGAVAIAELSFAGSLSLGSGSATFVGPTHTDPVYFYPYVQYESERQFVLVHPGVEGSSGPASTGAAVVYEALCAGTYRIQGEFARANNFRWAGNGVDVAVFRNTDMASPLFIASISSDHDVDSEDPFSGTGVVAFDVTTELLVGDMLRFVTFVGAPGDVLDGGFDATALRFVLHVDRDENDDGLLDECELLPVSDAVAREFSLHVGVDLVPVADAVGREFSVHVGPGIPPVADAVAREFTVHVASNVGPMDAVAREFTVFIGRIAEPVTDAIAREFTVFVGPVAELVTDGIAREFSVFVGRALEPVADAVAREFTVHVGRSTFPVDDGVAREFSVYVKSPDLRVVDIDTPPAGLTDDPMTISWTIRNDGDGPARGMWVDRVYVSQDQTPDEHDLVGVVSAPSDYVPASDSYEGTLEFNAPHVVGRYWILIAVDADQQLHEDGEGAEENLFVSAARINVAQAPRPNLIVTNITPPPNAPAGASVSVSWTVENVGNEVAYGPWGESLQGSMDDVIGNDGEPQTYYYEDVVLYPGESVRRTETFEVPNWTAGDYWIVACADPDGELIELHDDDNCGIAPVCVSCLQPDLQPTGIVTGDIEATAGEHLSSLAWTVANVGDGVAEGTWWDRLYLRPVDGTARVSLGYEYRTDGPITENGGTYTATAESIELPIHLLGDFHPAVDVDVDNSLREPGGESNNYFVDEGVTITIRQPLLPNLVVDEFAPQAPPEGGWRVGDEMQVTWTVENIGEIAASEAGGGWVDAIYISQNESYNADDYAGIHYHTLPLAAGDDYTATTYVSLPQQPGTYWLIIVTDVGDAVEEGADENDNKQVSTVQFEVLPPPRANLVVRDVSLVDPRDEMLAHGEVTVAWTVLNTGETLAEGYWRNSVYVTEGSGCTNAELLGEFYQYGPLEVDDPGTTDDDPAPFEETLSLPWNLEGTYRFCVLTDASNHINEGDFNWDNCTCTEEAVVIGQPPLPDLVVTDITVPDEPVEAGASVTLSWQVENVGEEPTQENMGWIDKVSLSRTASAGSGNLLELTGGSVDIEGPLEAGGTYIGEGVFTFPSVPGDYWIVVETNKTRTVQEGIDDENNRLVSGTPITVLPPPRPDLVVQWIETPPPAAAGSMIDLEWAITNIGEIPATGTWSERVFFSSDAAIGNDTLWASFPYAGNDIARNETVYRSERVPMPNVPAGFYVIVCLDPNNAIDESNEANNCLVGQDRAEVLLPDLVVSDVVAVEQATADDDMTISWTVTNMGEAPAQGSWLDAVHLTVDGAVSSGTLRTVQVRLGPLPASTSYTQTLELPVPGTIQGDYTVCIVSDMQHSVAESDEGEGNTGCAATPTMVVQPPRPDLVVTDISLVDDGLIAQSFDISYTVSNEGAARATGAWSERVVAVHQVTQEHVTLCEGDFFRYGPLEIEEAVEHTETVHYPTVPGEYRICVIVDPVEGDGVGLVNEGLVGGENNEFCAAESTFFVGGYNVSCEATPEQSYVGAEDSRIHLTGTATDATTGAPLANVAVAFEVHVRSTTRYITHMHTEAGGQEPVVTDDDGNYDCYFHPYATEAGQYSIIAGPPGSLDDEVDDTFRIYGMHTSPNWRRIIAYPNQPVVENGAILLKNTGDLLLGGIEVQVDPLPDGLTVDAWLGGSALSPRGQQGDSVAVAYRIECAEGFEGTTNVVLRFTSSQGAIASATLEVVPRPLPVVLQAFPSHVRATMFVPPTEEDQVDQQQQTHVLCQITNVGSGTSGNLNVLIPHADWLSLMSPTVMPPIGPDESAMVILTLCPRAGLALGNYTGSFVVEDMAPGSNAGVRVNFTFRASSEGTGTLEVVPKDESHNQPIYSPAAGIVGATVVLTDPTQDNQIVVAGTTDDMGRAVFSKLPAGYYNLEVRAADHLEYRGLVEVSRGDIEVIEPFLAIQGVTYTWVVEPTDYEDVYVFTLEAEFETNVPVPRIIVDPAYVDFADPTVLTGQSTQIDFTLTNEGLIRADDVRMAFEGNDRYEITPLIEELGSLLPNESIVVPVIIVDREFGLYSDHNSCGTGAVTCYDVECGGRQCMIVPVFNTPADDCGPPSGDGSPPAMPDYPPGSGGEPTMHPPSPLVIPDFCKQYENPGDQGPPGCNSAIQCCDKKPPVTGGADPVHLYSGEYYDQVEDLRIRGRGFDFVWARGYRSKTGADTAQGYNWDFSYNMYLQYEDPADPTNTNLVLHHEMGRRDVLEQDSGGAWGRDELFFEVTQDAGGAFTATMPDGKKLYFLPIDGSLSPGKLSAIVDRNENRMSLEYDELGRLWKIRDTLNVDGEDNRVITVGYNDAGKIESITDFAGRQVRYAYYGASDTGGAPGDLKSVTSPAVVDTPTGNDFPEGKTTTYTYTRGFPKERMNHNLLTITDGRRNDPADPTFGQGPWLINEYYPTPNEDDRNFDRVKRQTWGGDVVDIVYVPQIATGANHFAVMTTIVNDRVGNVKEFDFDIGNRLVAQREFTGRTENPDDRTTLQENRPEGRLRDGDPPYYEQVTFWNNDSKATREREPAGNEVRYVHEAELDPLATRRTRANVRQIIRRPGNHQVTGDQDEIIESFEYDTGMGACCGAVNFVTRHDDGRGTITRHEYDDFGNRTMTIYAEGTDVEAIEEWEYNDHGQMTAHIHPDNGSGHRRRDEYVYYGPEGAHQNGYLKQEIIDVSGEELTTTYEYDAVGNLIRTTDPRGHVTEYIVNDLDQVIRQIERGVEIYDGSGNVTGTVDYTTDTHFDANDNVTRVDAANFDDMGAIPSDPTSGEANPTFTTTYEYEVLNRVVRMTQEVAANHTIATEYMYDGNRNRTLVRSPEAVSGNQPGNVVLTIYDELDRVYREVRGAEDPADPPGPTSTTQYNYDANGQVSVRIEGVEDEHPHAWRNIYDAFGRLKLAIDPMGNVTRYTYDENGNLEHELHEGELVDEGPGGWGCDVAQLVSGIPPELCDMLPPTNVRLSETNYEYDERDRLTWSRVQFFDIETQEPIDDGLAETVTHYTPNSQVSETIDDRGNATTTDYDSVNRRHTVTDAKGNTVTYGYDDNSNVISVHEVDKSDLGNPDQEFTTTLTYDALNRQLSVTDNVGSVNRSYYDSHSNRARTLDALDHEVLYQFDGLSRLIRTIRDMDGTGLGSANPAAVCGDPDVGTESIVTEQGWDDSSRLIGQTDDNGNTTTYQYDGLNRKVATIFADATEQRVLEFDAHGNTRVTTDGNENVVTSQFDALDRLVRKDIEVGPGVSDDTTFEVFKYDGLSRLVWAEDDDTKVTRSYDSLSHVTREVQELYDDPADPWPPATIRTVYDAVGNQTELHYPCGRLVVTSYDELNRKKVIADATDDPGNPELIAEYWYIGASRVQRRDYGNGTRTEYTYDGITGVANPDGDFGVKHIVRTNHFRIADGTTIDDHTYTWDRMGNKAERKGIRPDGPQLTYDYTYDRVYRLVQSDKSDPSGHIETIRYELDGVGNRTKVIRDEDEAVYEMDATTPEPADFQMNQYTVTPFGRRSYDRNGNSIGMGVADPNCDGTIDSEDFRAFSHCFAGPSEDPGTAFCAQFDLDGDDDIDLFDVSIVQRLYGAATGAGTRAAIECDCNNRIVLYTDVTTTRLHAWSYDALARRVQSVSDRGGDSIKTVFLHGAWQVLEEHWQPGSADGTTYCYGAYIDDVLGSTTTNTRFHHSDDLSSTVAITGGRAQVLERYEYGDFGAIRVLDPDGSAIGVSAIDNDVLFTGRRLDAEMGMYFYRTRHLESSVGRFAARDAIGLWGDSDNLGNPFAYVGNSPWTFLDPFGEDSPGCDLPVWTRPAQTTCVLRCCALHDFCYKKRQCTADSWWPHRPASWGCRKCNLDVVACIMRCRQFLSPPIRRYYCGQNCPEDYWCEDIRCTKNCSRSPLLGRP